MAENCVTLGMAYAAMKSRSAAERTVVRHKMLKACNASAAVEVPADGPGTELRKLLHWFAEPSKECRCRERAATMNRWGVEKCRQNIETIVGWLMDELGRRGFISRLIQASAVRAVVSVAINRASGHQADGDSAVATLESELEKHETAKDTENEILAKDWPFVWTYYAADAIGEELRYSIRSVLKWQPSARVIVVGDRPSWYCGEFIEKPRITRRPHHAFKDCLSKIILAAKSHERFVWMMDDVYWVQPFYMTEAIAPKYVRHVSQQRFHGWKPKNKWARTRQVAYQWLLENNRPTYDFAAHLPQPIESLTLLAMESQLRLLENYRNWECIYFNAFYGAAAAQDWGRRFTRITKPIESFEPNRKILNHTHRSYTGGVEKYLSDAFHEKCKVEN